MGRRKKRKAVTYDSKETGTFFGLTFLIGAVFFAIAALSVSTGDSGLFNQAKNLFGDSTILTALVCTTVGLKFLGASFRFLTVSSLLAQVALVFIVPALLTSTSGTAWEIIRANPAETGGGEVGYYIVVNLLGETIPTQPATQVLIVLIMIVLIPLAVSVPLSKITEIVGIFLTKLINFFKGILKPIDETEQQEMSVEQQKALRLGDFNERLKRREVANQPDGLIEDEEIEAPITLPKVIKKPQTEENVDFTEAGLGEDGLSQTDLKYPDWILPPLSLLHPVEKPKTKETDIKEKADIIEQILSSFNIDARVEDAFVGPSVIQYALNIPMGIKVSRISTLGENIALALGVDSKAVRVETIPETSYLGIEVPRSQRDLVRIKELMSSGKMAQTEDYLPVPIGKNIHGESVIASINKMPHLLIAGATGSGKSVLTNTFITSLIMKKTPDEVRLILVDPKQVELMDYNGIPHLLTPVITDMGKVVNALDWSTKEMERRYTLMASHQVRNIEGFNKKLGFSAMPYIVIVIDEMADMMMTSDRVQSENYIVRLAQKARAVGIHLILATQRPSVNVITGIIKANIPGRIGMSVTSSTDSRVILDRMGAESLMGSGDLLYKAPDKTKSERLQCAFIEQEEVIKVVDFIKQQAPDVEYHTEITEKSAAEEIADSLGEISGDNLVEQSIRLVVQAGKGSSSYLQRRLGIGFNRAARLLEELEEAGVVGPANGSKPREVLISDADAFISQLRGGNF